MKAPRKLKTQTKRMQVRSQKRCREALLNFVTTIEAAGGIQKRGDGVLEPMGDTEWTDLGDAYECACQALGRALMIVSVGVCEECDANPTCVCNGFLACDTHCDHFGLCLRIPVASTHCVKCREPYTKKDVDGGRCLSCGEMIIGEVIK
jgi:hypothetical protein